MIRSFSHRGLRTLFETGDASGVIPSQAVKIRQLLKRLSKSNGTRADLMTISGFHPLRLKFQQEMYAVKVNAAWRLTFSISSDGDIEKLDYVQYH